LGQLAVLTGLMPQFQQLLRLEGDFVVVYYWHLDLLKLLLEVLHLLDDFSLGREIDTCLLMSWVIVEMN
jgi:hypothetical protein